MVCSEACQNKLGEIAVDRYSYRYIAKRAADPRRCVICGALLEGKVRCTKLYCSPRCAKRAWRAGVKADSLMSWMENMWGSPEELSDISALGGLRDPVR